MASSRIAAACCARTGDAAACAAGAGVGAGRTRSITWMMPLAASMSATSMRAPAAVMVPDSSAKATLPLPISVRADPCASISSRRIAVGSTCAASTAVSARLSCRSAVSESAGTAANALLEGASSVHGPGFALPSCGPSPAASMAVRSVANRSSADTISSMLRSSGSITASITWTMPPSNATSVANRRALSMVSAAGSTSSVCPESAFNRRRSSTAELSSDCATTWCFRIACSIGLPAALVRNSTFSLGSLANASLVGAKMVTLAPFGSSRSAAFTSARSVVRLAFPATAASEPADACSAAAPPPIGRIQSISSANSPAFLSERVMPTDSIDAGSSGAAFRTRWPKLFRTHWSNGTSTSIHSPALVSKRRW